MANELLTPDDITRESLRVLHQKLRFIGSINRQYDKYFGQEGHKRGSALRIRLPNKYTVSDGRTASPQATTEESTTLTVATQKHVDMSFYSDELALSLDDFSERCIQPAMAVLAAKMEADALSMAKDIYNTAGTPGTTPNDATIILNAGRKLDEFLAPEEGRTLLVNPKAQVSMVDALKGLYHAGGEIGKQYREGRITNALGFDWFTSTHIPTLTTGSRDNTTPLTNGASQAGSSLICDGFDATATIKVGDKFTIASVYAVHPETKLAYDFLQEFTVTADATCVGGAVTLSISPAIITSGAKQNVDAGPADGAALTFAGSASTNYPMNLAYHRDAFVFVTADLPLFENQTACIRKQYDGISLRYWQQPDVRSDELITRLDVYYGFKTVRPELACRVWG